MQKYGRGMKWHIERIFIPYIYTSMFPLTTSFSFKEIESAVVSSQCINTM